MPDSPRNDAGGWRPWQIYFALASLFITLSTMVYNVAVARTSSDGRIAQLERETAQIKTDYERRDVLEQRLMAIEQTEKRIEASVQAQNESLQKLLLEARRSR